MGTPAGIEFAPQMYGYGMLMDFSVEEDDLWPDGNWMIVTENTVVEIIFQIRSQGVTLREVVAEFTIRFVNPDAAEPELLYSFDFIDGGSSNNSAYGNANLSTNVSYASDNPNGVEGTTAWKADYANLSLTNGTRLGGKNSSTEYDLPNANIRTDFAFSEEITKVEIIGAATFGTASNVTQVYLQTSTDGVTWTTVAQTANKTGTLTFDNLTIASGSYLKLVVELTASGTNSGLLFTGMKVTGLAN